MAVPTDMKLYNAVKRKVYKRMPKHSAYRSGHLVRAYKAEFAKKHGARRRPYKGTAKPLRTWYREKWRTDTGKKTYTSSSSVFRPTRRVSRATAKTFSELGRKRIQRAKREKRLTGRVRKF